MATRAKPQACDELELLAGSRVPIGLVMETIWAQSSARSIGAAFGPAGEQIFERHLAFAGAQLLHGGHSGRHRPIPRRVSARSWLAERHDRNRHDNGRCRRDADDDAGGRVNRRHAHKSAMSSFPASAPSSRPASCCRRVLAGCSLAGRDRHRRGRDRSAVSASRSASCARPASTVRSAATRLSTTPATWSAPGFRFGRLEFGFTAVFWLAALFGVLRSPQC